MEGTGVHGSAHRGGDLVHQVPLCHCPSEVALEGTEGSSLLSLE